MMVPDISRLISDMHFAAEKPGELIWRVRRRVFFAVALLLVNLIAHGKEPGDALSDLPPGELGHVIRLGRNIVEQTGTHPLSKVYVGNALTCSSCHLDAGTHETAASFRGIATAYPAWSPREQQVITLEDRVLNCFMRSQNGIRPPNGSPVSVAVTTYITWLSHGEKLAMNPKAPLGPRAIPALKTDPTVADVDRGRDLFAEHCAHCHAADGQGTKEGPPVWGEMSYNTGAGLAGNDKLGAWIKVAMPLDDPTLTEQQALDVAAYVNSHSRPEFVLKDHLPPASGSGKASGDSEMR